MANEKILVVDDDANICELLRLYLTKEGYQVTVANDGEEGLEKFNAVKPDMVLLDVMMPRMDGLEVCRRIRKAGNTPVMMLTAKGETFDKVLGLELGADDYMVKPFDAKEVVARIKAVLRRCQTTSAAAESTEGVIEFDNLRLDMNSYELRVKGKVVGVWLCAAARCQQAERKRQRNNWQSFHKSVPPFGHIIIFHFVRINLANIIIPCKTRTFQFLSPYKCATFL